MQFEITNKLSHRHTIFLKTITQEHNIITFFENICLEIIEKDTFFVKIPYLKIYLEEGSLPKNVERLAGDFAAKGKEKEDILRELGKGIIGKVNRKEAENGNYIIHLFLGRIILKMFFDEGIKDKFRIIKELEPFLRHEITHIIQTQSKGFVDYTDRRKEKIIHNFGKEIDKIKVNSQEIALNESFPLKMSKLLRLLILAFKDLIIAEGFADFIQNYPKYNFDTKTSNELWKKALSCVEDSNELYEGIILRFRDINEEYAKKFSGGLPIFGELLKTYSHSIGEHIYFQIVFSKGLKGKKIDLNSIMKYRFGKLMKKYKEACHATKIEPLLCLHGTSGKLNFSKIIGNLHQARKKLEERFN